jgi:hypothetical protein
VVIAAAPRLEQSREIRALLHSCSVARCTFRPVIPPVSTEAS